MTTRLFKYSHWSSWLIAVLLVVAACGDSGPTPPLGDIRFDAVVLPTQAQSGHPAEVVAEIYSESEKHHVTLRLSITRLASADPSTVDPSAPGFEPDAWVWGTVIEKVNAGQRLTVRESFDLPPEIEAGNYATVLELNGVDFTAEDDALQGEEEAQKANNTVVGPEVLVVSRPEQPDLAITQLKLDHYGFDRPSPSVATFGADDELFEASASVVARTHDVASAVTVRFELGIPATSGDLTWYPLEIGAAGADGQYSGPLTEYTLAPQDQVDDDGVVRTMALLANRARGFHLGLHAPAAARDALTALSAQTACMLRLRIDPDNAIAEVNEENNGSQVPILFFPDGVSDTEGTDLRLRQLRQEAQTLTQSSALTASRPSTIQPGVRAENLIASKERASHFGNDDFDASYSIDAAFSWASTGHGSLADGDNVYLTSYEGKPLGVELGIALFGPKASRLRLTAVGDGRYRLYTSSTTFLSYCSDPSEQLNADTAGSQLHTSHDGPFGDLEPSCSSYQIVDENGGALENGDAVSLMTASGTYVHDAGDLGILPGSPTGTGLARLTIKRAGADAGDAGGARNIRFTSGSTVFMKMLGKDFTVLDARSVGNLDLDDANANVFAATVEAFGASLLSERKLFPMDGGTVVLYDHLHELYSASKKKEKEFLLGGVIPMTVTGTARVELGLRGRVTAGADRRMTFSLGPYIDLTGKTDATVHLAVASGGVTGDLRFVYFDELYDNAVVLNDDLTKQYQFGETFDLRTLDGDVYLHGKTAAGCGQFALHSCHFTKYLLQWNGYHKTFTVPIATFTIPE
jgi:hypothetical protein